MSLLLLATSSRAADFDGNGADDLVIGIPAEDVGSGVDAGAVEVLYGFVGGPVVLWEDSFTQDSDLPGASQSGDELGMSFATGDFDGDGFDDLAMGVPGESLGSIAQAGMVIVMYGSVYGLDDTTAETWDQDTSGVLGTAEDFDMFGWTLAAGDFNGDGRDDLAVGSPFEAIGTLEIGRAHV